MIDNDLTRYCFLQKYRSS